MSVFIHGNQAGHNESYTICRIQVPRERILEEIEAGFHPFHEMVPGKRHPQLKEDVPFEPRSRMCERCRAHQKKRFVTPEPRNVPDFNQTLLSREEHIHPEDEGKGTYFICRLAVHRADAVKETEAGWYPGYHVFHLNGEAYIRNNPNFRNPDNVNSRWPCPEPDRVSAQAH